MSQKTNNSKQAAEMLPYELGFSFHPLECSRRLALLEYLATRRIGPGVLFKIVHKPMADGKFTLISKRAEIALAFFLVESQN